VLNLQRLLIFFIRSASKKKRSGTLLLFKFLSSCLYKQLFYLTFPHGTKTSCLLSNFWHANAIIFNTFRFYDIKYKHFYKKDFSRFYEIIKKKIFFIFILLENSTIPWTFLGKRNSKPLLFMHILLPPLLFPLICGGG
jgi:hypothetical protein